MEENKKFRNHITIVFERMGKGLFILGSFFVWEILTDLETFIRDMREIIAAIAEGNYAELAVISLPTLILAVFLWQLLVWSKTYISIQDNAIVIEVHTLNRKTNTIGIKNISNVNMEQNLLEMLFRTCKVKLDTNSLSTADSTDVKIVLKKKDAEEFRRKILEIQQRDAGKIGEESVLEEIVTLHDQTGAEGSEIIFHGLLSIRWFSVLIMIGAFWGMAEVLADLFKQGITETTVIGVLSTILIAISFFASAAWDIMQGFFRYFNFKVSRKNDKIYLQYGLFKRVSYTIPVEKINAVKLVQSPQARILDMYMAELINVGMNDDEKEGKAFFLLYGKRDRIVKQMEELLPKFSGCMEMGTVRQPRCVWAVWSFRAAVFAVVMALITGVGLTYFAEYTKWILCGVGGLTVLMIFMKFTEYKTFGSLVDDEFLKIVKGHVGRTITFIKYDKIQIVETKQNLIAKKYGVQMANVFLLASASDRLQEVPYMEDSQMDKLAHKVVLSS